MGEHVTGTFAGSGASELGEVYGSPPTDASSPPTDHGPALGCVATSHISGSAGWWKSPCPDLARGRVGQPLGLLYNALLHRHLGAHLKNSKGMPSRPTESIPYASTVWLPINW